MLEGNCIL